jgi:flagellar basal body-associated protein FliL
MGFEPQTAGKPLVNVHKRTTKVNIGIAIGVVVFLIVGICFVMWAAKREARGEPVKQPAESPK